MEYILVKEVIAPICIIIGALILYTIISKLVKKILKIKINKVNSRKQETIVNLIINFVRYTIIIIAILMILEVYGIDTKSLVTSLGVIGLVFGLALQDMIKDLVAGVTLVFENAYNVGDIVSINGFKGEVIDLGVKTTKIKSYTGDIKVINNGSITEIINHSTLDSLAVVDVSVAYESDLKKVEKVLTDFCKKVPNEIPEIKGEATLLGIQELADSGIVFRLTAPASCENFMSVERKMRMLIKLEFDKNKISIPYPHVVVSNE